VAPIVTLSDRDSTGQFADDRISCRNIVISLVIRYEKLNGQETAVPSPARRDLFSGTSHLLFTGRTHLIFGAQFACCLPDKRTCLAGGWDDLSAYGVSIRWQTGRIASVMGADYNSYR